MSPGGAAIACLAETGIAWICALNYWKWIKTREQSLSSSRICLHCLKVGHRARQCHIAKQCSIDGCRMRHHYLLHGSKRVNRTNNDTTNGADQMDDEPATRVIAASSRLGNHNTTLLQVVRVRVLGEHARAKIVNTVLDPGAQACFLFPVGNPKQASDWLLFGFREHGPRLLEHG